MRGIMMSIKDHIVGLFGFMGQLEGRYSFFTIYGNFCVKMREQQLP